MEAHDDFSNYEVVFVAGMPDDVRAKKRYAFTLLEALTYPIGDIINTDAKNASFSLPLRTGLEDAKDNLNASFQKTISRIIALGFVIWEHQFYKRTREYQEYNALKYSKNKFAREIRTDYGVKLTITGKKLQRRVSVDVCLLAAIEERAEILHISFSDFASILLALAFSADADGIIHSDQREYAKALTEQFDQQLLEWMEILKRLHDGEPQT